MGKPCTDCGLLLQVFLGGSSLKGFSESDMMQSVDRCSMIKCSHVFKPQKQLGFVTKHEVFWAIYQDFLAPYRFCLLLLHLCFNREIAICHSLGGLYVQEAVFNGARVKYVCKNEVS